MRRKWIYLGAAAIVLLIIILARGHKKPIADGTTVSDNQSPVVSARLMTVHTQMVSAPVELPGTVEPYAEAQLAPKIMSTVHQVYVREGDRVRKGQTLIVLENRDLSAGVAQAQAGLHVALAGSRQAREAAKIQEVTGVSRVKQAEAQLAAARAAVKQSQANLDLVREGSRKQQKAQAAQGVAQAQAQYQLAKVSYDRMQGLFDQGVIAKQRLDEAKAQHDVALAALDSAKQQQSIVDEGARAQEEIMAAQAVQQSRGQLEIAEQNLRSARAALGETAIKREQITLAIAQAEQARAGLTQAEVQRGYAVIRAPFDGVITSKKVDPGTMVAPGSLLLVIQDTHRFRLAATVPEEKALLAAKGVPIRVILDSLPGRLISGSIDTVVPAADPQSRTFVVKASLPSMPGVQSGAFGRLLLPGRAEAGIYVPEEAIWHSGQLTGVYTVGKDHIARLRLVTLGKTAGGTAQVLSGLSDGDTIVERDISRVKEGAKVEPIGSVIGSRVAVEERL